MLHINKHFYSKFPKNQREKYFCDTLFTLKSDKNQSRQPLDIASLTLINLCPLVRFRARTVAGRFYKIPFYLGSAGTRDYFQALAWIFFARRFYNKHFKLPKKIGLELLSTAQQTSYSWRQRSSFHRVAVSSQPLLKFFRRQY